MQNRVAAFAFTFALSTLALGQCPASGLTLTTAGGTLGNPFTVGLSGAPGAPGLLGVDTATAVTPTPIGNVCLGLTPSLQLLPFTLGPSGQFSLSGLVPLQPALFGSTAHLQAAAIDPTQPSGSALSNLSSVTLRPPRIFFIDRGSAAPGVWTPGSWCTYDALSDLSINGPFALPFNVVDAIRIPALDWLAFIVGNGTTGWLVQCHDQNTGAPTLTIPIPTTGSGSGPRRLAVDGNTLLVLHPFLIRSYALPSGAPGFTTPLATCFFEQVLVVPAGGIAYVSCGTQIERVNTATGALLSPIALGGTFGGIHEWNLVGTTLYCLMQGNTLFGTSGLTAVDTTLHVPILPTPAPIPAPVPLSMLRYGPGGAGPSIFLFAQMIPAFIEIDAATGTVKTIPAPQGSRQMALSPGETEWLFLCNVNPLGGGCVTPALHSFPVFATSVSTVAALSPPGQILVSVPSATLRHAYVLSGNALQGFNTDPTLVQTTLATLPMSSTDWSAIVD